MSESPKKYGGYTLDQLKELEFSTVNMWTYNRSARSALPALIEEIERLSGKLQDIAAHDAWRSIPIDTHNCHLAITACEEQDDIARSALSDTTGEEGK